MNTKSIAQQLSQASIAVILGLIVNPDSAKAVSSAKVDNQLSEPTLLIQNTEDMSILSQQSLLENSSSATNTNNAKVEESWAVENVSLSNTPITLPPLNQPSNNSTVVVTPSKNTTSMGIVNSQEKPQIVAQSIPIPVTMETPETTPSPPPSEAVSIPIPVEMENPTARVESEVNTNSIPVLPAPELVTQETTSPVDNGNAQKMSLNIPVIPPDELTGGETPSSTMKSLRENQNNQNIVSQNIRIINPSSSPERKNNSNNGELVSAIPIQVEYFDPSTTPMTGDIAFPDLPQINSPNPYLPETQKPFRGYIWPAKGVFTSGYGWRWGRMHRGIDIAAPVGTPIVAAADGQVITAGWNSGGFGNLVKIRHDDGSVTLYAHNSRILVRRGDFVTQGQHIANMGSTGFSTGPHLHFEIHPPGSKPVDPLAFLPRKR